MCCVREKEEGREKEERGEKTRGEGEKRRNGREGRDRERERKNEKNVLFFYLGFSSCMYMYAEHDIHITYIVIHINMEKMF